MAMAPHLPVSKKNWGLAKSRVFLGLRLDWPQVARLVMSAAQFWQGDLLAGKRPFVAVLDFIVNFLAMHRHVGGSLNPNFDCFTVYSHHGHLDATVNDDGFAGFAREDEHRSLGD